MRMPHGLHRLAMGMAVLQVVATASASRFCDSTVPRVAAGKRCFEAAPSRRAPACCSAAGHACYSSGMQADGHCLAAPRSSWDSRTMLTFPDLSAAPLPLANRTVAVLAGIFPVTVDKNAASAAYMAAAAVNENSSLLPTMTLDVQTVDYSLLRHETDAASKVYEGYDLVEAVAALPKLVGAVGVGYSSKLPQRAHALTHSHACWDRALRVRSTAEPCKTPPRHATLNAR